MNKTILTNNFQVQTGVEIDVALAHVCHHATTLTLSIHEIIENTPRSAKKF